MRLHKILLLVTCLTFLRSNAQIAALKIGDKVPDIYLGAFLNDSIKKVKISDLKGKLVILDFWNIRCSICITGMPKMDSIQKRFGKQVQIIAITQNNEKEVMGLFSRIKFKHPDFPFVIGDTVFSSLFPHAGDPLHVWIDSNGVVSAITYHYNTNNETITKFLSGVNPQLSRRWDFGFNTDYPFLSEQNSSLLNYASFYSTLFHGLEEAYGTNFIRITNDMIQTTNSTLIKLYSIAFYNELYGFAVNHFDIGKDNRVIIEVKDKSRFLVPTEESKLGDWIKNNVFSYELKVPEGRGNEKFNLMRQDIDRYFPYTARIEKRKVKCLVLVNQGAGEKIFTKDTSVASLTDLKQDKSLFIQNMPIISLIEKIIYANPYLDIPIVNGTNIQSNITITLKSKRSDLKALNQELNSYGLALIEKDDYINILVIKDK